MPCDYEEREAFDSAHTLVTLGHLNRIGALKQKKSRSTAVAEQKLSGSTTYDNGASIAEWIDIT